MPATRPELESRERQFLAPYAQFRAETRGRKYKEEPPEWRTHYQRDRDRVIHSPAPVPRSLRGSSIERVFEPRLQGTPRLHINDALGILAT